MHNARSSKRNGESQQQQVVSAKDRILQLIAGKKSTAKGRQRISIRGGAKTLSAPSLDSDMVKVKEGSGSSNGKNPSRIYNSRPGDTNLTSDQQHGQASTRYAYQDSGDLAKNKSLAMVDCILDICDCNGACYNRYLDQNSPAASSSNLQQKQHTKEANRGEHRRTDASPHRQIGHSDEEIVVIFDHNNRDRTRGTSIKMDRSPPESTAPPHSERYVRESDFDAVQFYNYYSRGRR